MAEDHTGSAVHGLDHAADLDIHITISEKLANLAAILPQVDDGEVAGFVGGLWGADVEEAGAIGQLDDVVYVCETQTSLLSILEA